MNSDTIGTHATTTYSDESGAFCVRYHATEVFKLNRAFGEVTLKTGGWATVTTKKRINQACAACGLPFRVFQEGGAWFLRYDDGKTEPFRDGEAVRVVQR